MLDYFKDIEDKFKINISGKYNAGVYHCANCDFNSILDNSSIFKHMKGIALFRGNVFAIVECPKCFKDWYFHIKDSEEEKGNYYYFKEFVRRGENRFYNEKGEKR